MSVCGANEGTQFEAAIKNANNLGQLRKNALHFKDEVKTTLNQPIELLSDILQRLMLKNKNFKPLKVATTMILMRFGKSCYRWIEA